MTAPVLSTDPATVEQFDELKTMMRDFAQHCYNEGALMVPATIVVMTRLIEEGRRVVQMIPVAQFQTEEMGSAGKSVLAQLLHSLSEEPTTLVVGYMSEAWLSKVQGVQPSADPAREECIVVALYSAECQGVAYCAIDRSAEGPVTIGNADIQFASATSQLSGRFFREPAQSGATVH